MVSFVVVLTATTYLLHVSETWMIPANKRLRVNIFLTRRFANHSHFASFEPWRQENVDDKIYEKWQNLHCLHEKTLVALNSSSSRIDADGSKLGANLCRNQISTQNYIFIQYSSISREDWCQPIKEMAELNDIIADCTFKIVYIQNKVFFTPHSLIKSTLKHELALQIL